MKILVFSDLHYYDGGEKRFDAKRKLVEFAVPMLDKLIETAAEEDVLLTVNLGDIIQDTNDREKDIECLCYMFEYLKKFKCPCCSVLGNHDLKMMDSVEEVLKIMGYENSRYSFDAEGFHLVFLTTDVAPEFGLERGGIYKIQNLSAEGVQWLKNDLEKNSLPCLIFMHFPLAENAYIHDECMFLKNRAEVKEIINNDKNIKGVFAGHQHIAYTIEENGIKHYILGSPTASPEADGVPSGAFVIIETDGDDIKVSERRIVL